jgi:hypothetical protein
VIVIVVVVVVAFHFRIRCRPIFREIAGEPRGAEKRRADRTIFFRISFYLFCCCSGVARYSSPPISLKLCTFFSFGGMNLPLMSVTSISSWWIWAGSKLCF